MNSILTLAMALASWTHQITATGSGMTEQQARIQVQALCQGSWGSWRQRCADDGGRFDDVSEQACFRFVPVCTGAQNLWNCNYFTSVTCVLSSNGLLGGGR